MSQRKRLRTEEDIRPHLMRTPAGFPAFRAVVVALLIVVGVGAGVALVSRLGDSAPPTAASHAPPHVRAVHGHSIRLPSGAVDVAAGGRAVWVTGFGTMTRIDPDTDRVVAKVRTPGTEDLSRVAVAPGAVWVTADGGRLYRIDPTTNEVVATVPVGGSIQGVEIGGGYVWVTRPTEGVGELVRVDPATSRVAGAPIEVGSGPVAVLYAFGALWVTNSSPSSVVRVDPSTGEVTQTGLAGPVAAGYGSLWAASEGAVVRADPATGQVTARIPVPRAQAVAVAEGRVWALASPRSSSPTLFYPVKHTAALWEVDPATNGIAQEPVRMDALQPSALAADGAALWVTDYGDGTVDRFDLVR